MVYALRNQARVPICDEKLTFFWLGLKRAQGERETVFADLLVSLEEHQLPGHAKHRSRIRRYEPPAQS